MNYRPPSLPYAFTFPLLAALILMSFGAGAARASEGGATPAADAALALETTTPIKHLITVMQSNHSFDSLFGAYPGADGIPAGACIPVDPTLKTGGECIEPFPISNNGANFDNSHETFATQYRDGRNDGFVHGFRKRGEDGTLAMGYYTESDIPFSYNAANEYVLFDRFFTSASAGTVPNRMFWVTGRPGIASYPETALPPNGYGDLPTIFDRLQASGVSWKFYVENYSPEIDFRNREEAGTAEGNYAQVNWVPLLGYARYVDDPRFDDNIVDLDEYFTDLERNQLPAVSYVVTVGSSGHPPSSLVTSERMLKGMVNALMMSPSWSTSALQWAYDDWGGWYDHVPPPQVDEFGYGFRTPALLVSPYARRGYIDSEVHDFTSVLAFIQDNWSVAPLATRDRDAVSIATAMDFDQPPRPASVLSMSRGTTGLVIPKRSVIHLSYAIAISSAGLVIGAAFVSDNVKRRRQ